MVEKVCQNCGRVFTPKDDYRNYHAKYCSKKCYGEAKAGKKVGPYKPTPPNVCLNCGKEYRPKPSQAAKSHYCCASCRSRHIQKGERSKGWKGGKKPRTCPECGKDFLVDPGDTKRVYCSRECANRVRERRQTFTCPQCGKVFIRKASHVRYDHSFCSYACFRKSPFWRKSHKVTKIELKIREELTRLGVEFVPEYPVDIYSVDIFVPSINLAVECDGDYWHSSKKVRERDAERDGRLSELGITTLRLPEKDIEERLDHCLNLIKCAIAALA